MISKLGQRFNLLPRTVYLLSACNGFLFINQSLLITISALIGYQLADNKSLATLPLALQFAAIMLTTVPASLFMGRFGRKAGFMLGNALGLSGATVALYSLFTSSFYSFCVATICFGMFAAFGNYYRFTAAELVEKNDKGVAISWVMAGGVLAALIGPNLANWSSTLFEQTPFAGPFAVLIVVYVLSVLTLTRFYRGGCVPNARLRNNELSYDGNTSGHQASWYGYGQHRIGYSMACVLYVRTLFLYRESYKTHWNNQRAAPRCNSRRVSGGH